MRRPSSDLIQAGLTAAVAISVAIALETWDWRHRHDQLKVHEAAGFAMGYVAGVTMETCADIREQSKPEPKECATMRAKIKAYAKPLGFTHVGEAY